MTGVNQDYTFEFEMATLDLKGRRWADAVDKFASLARTVNNNSAWCGLAISKYGLIMEQVTVEEIFYCFQKALELSTEEEKGQVRETVLYTSKDVINNLSAAHVGAIMASRKVEKEKFWAGLSTAFMAANTYAGSGRNNTIKTVLNAGMTSISFDTYRTAKTNQADLLALADRTKNLIDEIKSYTTAFLLEDEQGNFDSFLKEANDSIRFLTRTEEQVEQDRKDAERKQIDAYITQKKIELQDPEHLFHQLKAQAIEKYNNKKDATTIISINKALQEYKDDEELKKMQEDIVSLYQKRLLIKCIIPYLLVAFIAIKIDIWPGNSSGSALIALSPFICYMYIVSNKMKSLGIPKTEEPNNLNQ